MAYRMAFGHSKRLGYIKKLVWRIAAGKVKNNQYPINFSCTEIISAIFYSIIEIKVG